MISYKYNKNIGHSIICQITRKTRKEKTKGIHNNDGGKRCYNCGSHNLKLIFGEFVCNFCSSRDIHWNKPEKLKIKWTNNQYIQS